MMMMMMMMMMIITYLSCVDVDDDEFGGAGVLAGVARRPLEGVSASGVYDPHVARVGVDLHTLYVLKRTAVVYKQRVQGSKGFTI